VAAQDNRLLGLYSTTSVFNFFQALKSANGTDLPTTTGGTGGPAVALPVNALFKYRGYSVVNGTIFVVAEESAGALTVYRANQTTGAWVNDGVVYALPSLADRSPSGVLLRPLASGVGYVAYVSTNTGKVFAFDTEARSWINDGAALYTAPSGFALRGMAAAPVAPSATPSPTASSTASTSLTATASPSPDPAVSPTSSTSVTGSVSPTASLTPSASITPSSSATPSNTPSPSPSAVNVLPGADIVVARVATGVASGVATPLLLDALAEGATPGSPLSLLGTVTMPLAAGSPRVTVSGADTRWGALSRSMDGRYVVVAGVDAAPGGAVTGVARTIATLSFTGAISVPASFNSTVFSGGIFSAASVDGTSGFWATGAAAVVGYRGVWWVNATIPNGRVTWSTGQDGWLSLAAVGGRLHVLYGQTTAVSYFAVVSTGSTADLPTGAATGATVLQMPVPAGHRYRGVYNAPGSLLAIAEETTGGVFVARWNGTAFVLDASGVYVVPTLADRTPQGVAGVGSMLYVSTATGKVYALDASTNPATWANGGAAVYTAPAGFALRGMAPAPVAPSATPSPSGTRTPTGTPTTTRSGSATPTGSQTGTAPPSGTPTTSRTPSGTPSGTPPATGTPTGTAAPTGTPTPSNSGTGSVSTTRTPSGTRTPPATSSSTPSVSASRTASSTASVSASGSETASISATQTGTPSASGTETGTPSSSATQSGSPSSSETGTGTGTPSASGTGTASRSATTSRSRTARPTASATKSRLPSASRTRSRTATPTRTKTATKTKTKTKTKSAWRGCWGEEGRALVGREGGVWGRNEATLSLSASLAPAAHRRHHHRRRRHHHHHHRHHHHHHRRHHPCSQDQDEDAVQEEADGVRRPLPRRRRHWRIASWRRLARRLLSTLSTSRLCATPRLPLSCRRRAHCAARCAPAHSPHHRTAHAPPGAHACRRRFTRPAAARHGAPRGVHTYTPHPPAHTRAT
jgi:hypothetical protein